MVAGTIDPCKHQEQCNCGHPFHAAAEGSIIMEQGL